jgi:signal transduction histidine kinase/DNA-binding NarL/FixJ family response regulator
MKVFTDDTGIWVANGPNVIANSSRYIIHDFRSDPHYLGKPYVSGFPHMVSYLEVPLISPLGYVLGSYCVVDNKPRPDFNSEPVIETMTNIASVIMSHLDLVKTKQVRTRSEQLIRGLGEFMERESPIPHSRGSFSITDSLRSTRNASEAGVYPGAAVASVVSSPNVESLPSPDLQTGLRPALQNHASTATALITSTGSSEYPFSPLPEGEPWTPPTTPPQLTENNPFDQISTTTESTMPVRVEKVTPPEAKADLPDAPEAYAPGESSSTAPLTAIEYHTSPISGEVREMFARAAATIREAMSMDGLLFVDAVPSGFGSRSVHTTPRERGADPFVSDPADSNTEETPDIKCAVLSQSTNESRHPRNLDLVPSPKRLSEAVVQRFIRRYPRGHIFTADALGPIDCSYGPGSVRSSHKTQHGSSRAVSDVGELFAFLPEARYIIFLPLWHFQRECWFAATFGWVQDATLSIELADINLLTAFGNSVMVEVSRFEALAVSRAKSDFISSISHELRSPLHGIMASGELLREAVEDAELLPMLDMIDSCGTTLLDTFDNLLDFAKINRAVKAVGKQESLSKPKPNSDLLLTDLSRLVEDVVESVQLGHTSKTAFHGSSQREGILMAITELSNANEDLPDTSVLVTLNIEKRASWMTKLDIGAWKRIVMNLFGNALKYTRSGHIEVGLSMIQIPGGKSQSRSHICFFVKDTGIGMSPDYLKYHLFTPFAQENTLSPGTGLGLSIVQQIAKTLGGDIDVKSQIGVGTIVKVVVPLSGDSGGSLSLQLAPIMEGSQPDAHHELRGHTLCCLTTEAYHTFSTLDVDVTSEMRDRACAVKTMLRDIAEDQLGMKIIFARKQTPIPEADVYFFDSYILGKALAGALGTTMPDWLLQLKPLVVLSSGARPLKLLGVENQMKMLHLRHPVGPKKLATVLLEALKAGKPSSPVQSGLTPEMPESSSVAYQTLTDIPTRPKEEERLDASAPLPETPSPTTAISSLPLPTSPSSGTTPPPSQTPDILHLLLVDDNPINLKILTTLVKKLSHTFATASNGLEALHLFKASLHPSQRLFDVVFMDISMPVMNGFESTREIRKVERENGMGGACSGASGNGNADGGGSIGGCQIVALTGLGSENSRQEAFSSGTNLFLTKPVKLAEIKKVLIERVQQMKRPNKGRVPFDNDVKVVEA